MIPGSEFEPERDDLLSAANDTEFIGSFYRIDPVIAAVVDRNDVSLRGLRLEHVRRVVGRAEWMRNRADNLAAVLLDRVFDGVLQHFAENVVGRDEVPSLAELRHGATNRASDLVGVINPMHRNVGRAGLTGEVRRTGTGQQHSLVLLFRNVENGEADGRVHEIRYGVDLVDVEPPIGQSGADVRLVLVIAGDDFDRLAVDLVSEFLRGHLGGFNRTVA